jgi:type 1 glutamine amidotransferase
MNRREWLHQSSLAALALGGFPLLAGRAKGADRKHRLLMYTRSGTFQHDCVNRKGGKLSLAEQIVTDLGTKHGIEVVCEKDGRVFVSDEFPKFDGFLFETQGDLCAEQCVDGSPPMPREGKKALLDAVHGGKGFVGCHCASDTFHSWKDEGDRWKNQPAEKIDPYIAMLGGEFSRHGDQQKALMHLCAPNFPGLKDRMDFRLHEEWYSLKNFAPDLHVLLVQETKGMENFDYQRPNFPATWARKHGKGRVFYTSMGHRDDVWQNPLFQEYLLAGLAWTLGDVDADVTPNLDKVAPQAAELPKK